MSGSVFFAILLAVIFIVLGIAMSPMFIIPAVVVILVALFSAPLLAAIARGGQSRADTGTPRTEDAAYEPVAQPEDRSV
jgi:sugar phosphate permease